MDKLRLLRLFDSQMRADPAAEAGVERVWADGVLRTLGAYEMIGWWDFPPERARQIAAREASYFAGRNVEWKVYSHDGPNNLAAALESAGFEPGEVETFLVLYLGGPSNDSDPAAGIEVRRVRDPEGLADLMAVGAAAFGRDDSDRLAPLQARLDDETQGLYVAYAAGEPIASGRLELAPARLFAGLYGGGVKPGWRGRGAYRALVAARAEAARRWGCRWLTVDALATSRPILERLGFVALGGVRGWTLPRAA